MPIPPSSTKPTAPAVERYATFLRRGLRAFTAVLLPIALGYAILEFLAWSAFGDLASLLSATIILTVCGLTLWARRQLDRDRNDLAIRVLWSGLLVGVVTEQIVRPEMPLTLVLVCVLVVALALPHVRGTERTVMLVAAGLTALAVSAIAEFRPYVTMLPDWYLSTLRVTSAAAVIGMLLFVVSQTNRHLTEAFADSAAAYADVRAARAELQAEHERLSVTLGSIADGVIATDAGGRIHLLNAAATRLLATSQPAAVGRPFAEVFDLRHIDDRSPIARALLETSIGGAGATRPAAGPGPSTGHLLTPAGERLVEASGAPIPDGSGSTAGVVIVFRDVTDQRRAARERLEIERRMQETQKLESLGVLAGGIAHDFNNLLVAILGNASLALAELPPAAAVRENLQQIEVASQRAAELARQMLAYSGKGRFVIEALDINAVVHEISQLLSVSVPKSTTLRYALAPDLPPIEADATQLRQVVLNLVVNAAEAIGDGGGTIRIRTAHVDADARYLEGALVADELQPGRYVSIEVSDTGSGMDAETRRRIFDPFFTTKFTGRGLGLAAVLGIVRGHRGAIRVYSEPGRGSSFKILLPAATGPAGAAPAPAAPSARGWLTSGTVLVVDDEAAVRALTARMLEPVGLIAVTAVDGSDGVEQFRAEPDRFSMVLLDLTMPRLGGVEAFEAIRAIRPQVPVVLMSGYAEEEASSRFVGRGLSGFLQKPFSCHELLAAARTALEGVQSVR